MHLAAGPERCLDWIDDPRDEDEGRAGLLDALPRTWPGWRIEWADRIADVVGHLGKEEPGRRDRIKIPAADVTRARHRLADRFVALWPAERAYLTYVTTVNAGHESTSHLPVDERRATRRQIRRAAESAMEAAVADLEEVAVDIAGSIRGARTALPWVR